MDANDPNNSHKGYCKPEIGRGCTFCEGCCSTEPEAELCEGCFKLHETPWLEGYPDNFPTDIYEVRFKNTRRSFYQNVNNLPLKRGDIVAVEASPGHDIGVISLTGDLVAKQMRRTGFNPFNGEYKKIYRKAKPYDIERWQEAIELEQETMIHARQIAADMGLNMKIGDVEYQGDKIKAIFYYIADERVDFRELIKVFAERFHIRIEMKQIGARQEAGRIGGLGACGRELCCASWISSFTSVTTGAARAQDISLNPQKLAGQCSKLKCCLMYEYDTYADARKEFPRLREPLQTLDGEYHLVKNDILAGTMTFSSSKGALANLVTLPIARVKEIISLNRAGKKADQLQHADDLREEVEEPTFRAEEDSITRFDQTKRRGKNRRNRNKPADGPQRKNNVAQGNGEDSETANTSKPNRQDGNTDNRPPRDKKSNRSSRGNESNEGEGRENPQPRNGSSEGPANRPPKAHIGDNGDRRSGRNNRGHRRNDIGEKGGSENERENRPPRENTETEANRNNGSDHRDGRRPSRNKSGIAGNRGPREDRNNGGNVPSRGSENRTNRTPRNNSQAPESRAPRENEGDGSGSPRNENRTEDSKTE